jgi:uncharacterized glyoxalase superfamily protein PhnB
MTCRPTVSPPRQALAHSGDAVDLIQCRIVTEDVRRLAAFYARLVGSRVVLNEYYVEVPAGPASVGFSRRRFTEYSQGHDAAVAPDVRHGDEVMLDFEVADVDAEYPRVAALGVEWVMPPTIQPWGNRSMIFRDSGGHLINVFSRPAP